MNFDESKICATGTWLYDGSIICKVIIVEESIWPAFYDPADDPMAEDQEIPCVSVWYTNPRGSISELPDGGYFHTLEKAKFEVQKKLKVDINWNE
jgi:hypothetical protein